MSWNDRQDCVWQFSLYDVKVSAADAADMNFDEHLTCQWRRNRTILEVERGARDIATVAEHHGFHIRTGCKFLVAGFMFQV